MQSLSSSASLGLTDYPGKVDERLPGKGNSNSHGARPVHLIITMMKWVRTSSLPTKHFLPNAPHVEAFLVRVRKS